MKAVVHQKHRTNVGYAKFGTAHCDGTTDSMLEISDYLSSMKSAAPATKAVVPPDVPVLPAALEPRCLPIGPAAIALMRLVVQARGPSAAHRHAAR